ncbi:hypothetical protein [Aquipseudomonas alcaligenes]|uniref:hypothetical protein n=1 Tax=Aquipseudomonas alcaligenes TaxID=43263 RepID=UPI0011157E4D|nr:hypothetical protein [Pseudomonas alcaligenes]
MIVIGLVPLQDSPVPTVSLLTTTAGSSPRLADYPRRQAGLALCQSPLKRRTYTSLGYYNGFARMPAKLTSVDSAHGIVELTLIGAIVGAFR